MTRHSEYKMETRPYGDGYANYVQITCGHCGYEAWRQSSNAGWASRVFRAHGWKVGSKPHQHRCPKCFGAAKSSRRTPDNPVIPKEIGNMLKTRLVTTHVRTGLLGSSAMNGFPSDIDSAVPEMPPETPQEVVLTTAGRDVPGKGQSPPTPAPDPALAYHRPVRGKQSYEGTTVFETRKRAAAAATKVTHSIDGIGFLTLPLEFEGKVGWVWIDIANATPEQKQAWAATRTFGPQPRPRLPNSPFGPSPVVVAGEMNKIRKPDPMTITKTKHQPDAMLLSTRGVEPETASQPKEEPMPSTQPMDNIVPIIAREPTRAERATIHDELTVCYDIADQRYTGSNSDKSVAEHLNVPRAWVTGVREMFFGDYDRNSANEKRAKDLDEAIAIAKAATTRLLEMASEAENLEQALWAARKKLEG